MIIVYNSTEVLTTDGGAGQVVRYGHAHLDTGNACAYVDSCTGTFCTRLYLGIGYCVGTGSGVRNREISNPFSKISTANRLCHRVQPYELVQHFTARESSTGTALIAKADRTGVSAVNVTVVPARDSFRDAYTHIGKLNLSLRSLVIGTNPTHKSAAC